MGRNAFVWKEFAMGCRNRDRQRLTRLECRTLDAKFLTGIEHGLNCSPVEAEAVLQVVKEVYLPHLDPETPAAPGKVTLVAIDADERAGKPIRDCQKRRLCLRTHRVQIVLLANE